MARRSETRAPDGALYAVPFPEWHVLCAAAGCEGHALVAGGPLAGLGEALTARAADKLAQQTLAPEGWRRIKGLWYCPVHAALASEEVCEAA